MNKYIVQYDDHGNHFECNFQADDYGHAEEQAKDYSDAPILQIVLDTRQYWLHKFEVAQAYGGSEEGGWWYDTGIPVDGFKEGPFDNEDKAFERCRELNDIEHEESEKQDYGYTSVLSHRSEHFEWGVSEDKVAKPYPEFRPYYE